MENTQDLTERKENDQISMEDIFKLVKETWPQMKNIKIHKALKQILKFGLLQSASKDDLKGLNHIVKLLAKHQHISDVNQVLELAIENDEKEAVKVVLKLGNVDINSVLPKSHMSPIELSFKRGLLEIANILIQNGACVDY